MRIKLKTSIGQYRAGDIIETDYTTGSNLCFFGHAELAPDEPEGKAVEQPPKDKMVRKPKTKRKARPRGQRNGRNSKNQNA